MIDYELADWNPKWYDLATYLSEFCCDNNSRSSECCIKYYLQNWPTEAEIRKLVLAYMQYER